MFASYKGEGTGAVRHMFSHHILKPERMPIEANVWGTPQSSGAFSTLYRSRLLRALDYREAPFEIGLDGRRQKQVRKVFRTQPAAGQPKITDSYPKNGLPKGRSISRAAVPPRRTCPTRALTRRDGPAVLRQRALLGIGGLLPRLAGALLRQAARRQCTTTRHKEEVQDTDSSAFAEKLQAVFAECHRVLRDDGRLVFSYHHSREDGWTAVANAILALGSLDPEPTGQVRDVRRRAKDAGQGTHRPGRAPGLPEEQRGQRPSD